MCSDVLKMSQNQFLKLLHEDRCYCQRSVVVKSCYLGFLWDGDDGGAFEAGRDFTQLQRSIEDL